MYVNEGDKVKKGSLLAKLDTKDLELKRSELKEHVLALENKIEANRIEKEKLYKDLSLKVELMKFEIEKLDNLIKAKEHEINAQKIKLDKLKRDYERFLRLYKENKISKEKFENIKSNYFAMREALLAKKVDLRAIKKDLKALKIKLSLIKNSYKDIDKLQKLIKAQQKEKLSLIEKLKLVNKNIKDSFLYAPFDGVIAKRFVNSKEVVAAGEKIFSIVNPKDLYALVLLEETKLKGVAPGCEAMVYIDALKKEFKGRVSKILPASAATFALVPRDISSGEFTKLAQRFYVRIKFIDDVDKALVGMSGEVVIRKCKNE
jgi:membrane fusion protein (multidrug efflux system)